uniref:copper-binding protein n=1 Tax=unclassified Variovorax TaxID=663243 RepID=UPI000D48AB7E
MSLALHRTVRAAAIGLCVSCLMAAAAGAQPKPPESEAAPVFTRAVVRSFHEEAGGKAYVRLKLLPRAKLPFTVQTFRVADRSLLKGLAEGASVKFTARHIDGENTVTSIQPAVECRRFQPCD